MVLRYKILTACVIVVFAVVWFRRIEYFPLTSNDMYADGMQGGGINYFDLRDSSGALVNDLPAFYVAPTTSGDATVQWGCFGDNTKVCRDYFRLVAQWLHQPITFEHLFWDYKTGERKEIQTLTISP